MSTNTTHDHYERATQTTGADERRARNAALANAATCDEERVRLTEIRAYVLWELAGKPQDHGARERFWHEAEKAINAYFPTAG